MRLIYAIIKSRRQGEEKNNKQTNNRKKKHINNERFVNRHTIRRNRLLKGRTQATDLMDDIIFNRRRKRRNANNKQRIRKSIIIFIHTTRKGLQSIYTILYVQHPIDM